MPQPLNDEPSLIPAQRRVEYSFFAALCVALAAIEWLSYWTHSPRRPVLFTLVAVCAVGVGMWRASGLHRQLGLRRAQRVASEKTISEYLTEFHQRDARVFHDVQVGGMNLDHVVISTHGIYAVEAMTFHKRWDTAAIQLSGETIRVDVAPNCNPARNAGRAAHWLELFLAEAIGKTVSVRGVVVFPRSWVLQASAEGAVCLIDPKSLLSFIKRQPQTLDARTVKVAALHLSRYLRRPVPRLLPKVTSR